ncbi:MAG: c-type cytochrome biogenesis protein CcmI [Armatimonadetes bacterium]|nr:c-type cytochrome biogenesis protein CcmI [Armatimonadota bacterium]
MGWLVVAVLVIVAATAAYVLAPLRRRGAAAAGAEPDDRAAERARHLRALREIELDFRTGKLSAEDYQALRRRYETAAIAALKAMER